MLRGVKLEFAAATNSSACESPHSASFDSDSSNVTTTDKADWGILDYDCIAETQQMLPWGSQYCNIFSREGTRGSSLPYTATHRWQLRL